MPGSEAPGPRAAQADDTAVASGWVEHWRELLLLPPLLAAGTFEQHLGMSFQPFALWRVQINGVYPLVYTFVGS